MKFMHSQGRMNVTLEKRDNGIVAALNGRLDTLSAQEVEAQLHPLVAADVKDAVIDCTEMSYISSSGLRIFLSLQKRSMANGCRLALRGLRPEIREIFDMAGFSSILHIL